MRAVCHWLGQCLLPNGRTACITLAEPVALDEYEPEGYFSNSSTAGAICFS